MVLLNAASSWAEVVTLPPPLNPHALRLPAALLHPHSAQIGAIYALAGCSERQFQPVYLALLNVLAGYLQTLPAPTQPAITLLAQRLTAAQSVLFRRRAILLPVGEAPENSAQSADLWTYLVFCLALLYGLARDLDAWVITVWAQHERLGPWRPSLAPRGLLSVPKATHYSVHPAPIRPTADWTALVAGALMPTVGLQWLWRDPLAASAWMQALRSDLPAVLQPLFADLPFLTPGSL